MSAFRSQRVAGHRRRGVCGDPEVVGLVDQFLAEFTCEEPERLRLFADRVFEECQDRIRREPWCLPVMGAVAARGEVIIRGLITARVPRRSTPKNFWYAWSLASKQIRGVLSACLYDCLDRVRGIHFPSAHSPNGRREEWPAVIRLHLGPRYIKS
jgi:hypothetical protein